MIAVSRLDHIALRVRDLDEAVARWSWQFGLRETRREQGASWLACDTEPVTLELIAAADPGPDHTAFELAPGFTVADAEIALRAGNVAFTPLDGAAVRLSDPDGRGVELIPSRGLTVAPQVTVRTDVVPGLHPRKLGHVNMICGDLAASRSFYEAVLGLRLTDTLGALGVWLHFDGGDHHGVALVTSASTRPPGFHHFALEVADWGQLRVMLDHLGRNGRWLAWGPVRHGMGQNLCAYVRIPEERTLVEVYCDMEQLRSDHVAREWPDDTYHSNTWGILPPRSYFRFDDVAVAWEREQREMRGEPLPPPATGALVLHDNPRSLCAQRVRFLLAELDLPYERRFVDLRTSPRPDWHFSVNSTGGVPALVDGDLRLAESIAIVRYLAARSGAYDLYPLAPAERAIVDWMIDAINDDLRLATIDLSKVAWGLRVGSGLFAAQPEPARIPEVVSGQAPRLARVASLLGTPPYACLGRFTLADVVAAPMLHRLRCAPGALDEHPRLAVWADEVCRREAWTPVGAEAGLDDPPTE